MYRNKRFSISTNTLQKHLLVQIQEHFTKLQIHSRLFLGVRKGYTGKDGYVHRGDFWILSIDRKADLHCFVRIISPYLKHKQKIRDAQKVLINIERRNLLYGNINMPKDELTYIYA